MPPARIPAWKRGMIQGKYTILAVERARIQRSTSSSLGREKGLHERRKIDPNGLSRGGKKRGNRATYSED